MPPRDAKATTPPAPLPAQEDRPKHLRLDHGRVLARETRLGREAAGISQSDLARRLGRNKGHVARCELGHERNSHRFVDAPRMPSELALRLVRWAASLHSAQVVEAVEIQHGDDHAARLSCVTQECTDVPRTLAAALSDGVLTDGELELLMREAREATQAARELDRWATVQLARRARERSDGG